MKTCIISPTLIALQSIKYVIPVSLCLILFSSCGNKNQSSTYGDVTIADEEQTSDWLAYGRTHNERRFSPATDINTENVTNLKVDWFMDLPNDVGLVSTPLVVDGVMYFTGTMNIIRAVNAVNGDLIWEYDPKVGEEVRGKKKSAGYTTGESLFMRAKFLPPPGMAD